MQPSLFDDPNEPHQELLDSIFYLLEQKPATLDEVRAFLQNETPRWLSKHARPAVSYLLDIRIIDATTGELLRHENSPSTPPSATKALDAHPDPRGAKPTDGRTHIYWVRPSAMS